MKFECITHTVSRNHTRRDGEHTGILYISRTRIYLTDHRLHIVLIPRTFVPRFQFENQHTERTTLSCQQSVTRHFLHVFQLRYFHQAFFNTPHHFIRCCQRTACRRTHINKNNPLILVGYQTGLCGIHQEHKQHYGTSQQRPCQPSALDKEQYNRLIFIHHHIESRIESLTETCRKVVLLRSVFINIRFQQQCTQSRTQSQRIDCGNTHRNRHRQTELRIKRTGSAAHEGHRNKHRHKHQRRGDNGITDSFHSVDTCHIR